LERLGAKHVKTSVGVHSRLRHGLWVYVSHGPFPTAVGHDHGNQGARFQVRYDQASRQLMLARDGWGSDNIPLSAVKYIFAVSNSREDIPQNSATHGDALYDAIVARARIGDIGTMVFPSAWVP
jgi:hypothetical protein